MGGPCPPVLGTPLEQASGWGNEANAGRDKDETNRVQGEFPLTCKYDDWSASNGYGNCCVNAYRDPSGTDQGLYGGFHVTDPTGGAIWKFDLWTARSAEFAAGIPHRARWSSLLTEESRVAILAIKEVVCSQLHAITSFDFDVKVGTADLRAIPLFDFDVKVPKGTSNNHSAHCLAGEVVWGQKRSDARPASVRLIGSRSVIWGSGLGTVTAGDVVFQFVDGEFLIGDDGFNDIADGDDSDEFVVLYDGQVSDAFVGHEGHAFLKRLVGSDVEDVACHQFADGGFPGGFSFEDNFSCVVAFGEDADDLVVFEDEHGSDVLLSHEFKGLIDGL